MLRMWSKILITYEHQKYFFNKGVREVNHHKYHFMLMLSLNFNN